MELKFKLDPESEMKLQLQLQLELEPKLEWTLTQISRTQATNLRKQPNANIEKEVPREVEG